MTRGRLWLASFLFGVSWRLTQCAGWLGRAAGELLDEREIEARPGVAPVRAVERARAVVVPADASPARPLAGVERAPTELECHVSIALLDHWIEHGKARPH